jgi:hypothetical protein
MKKKKTEEAAPAAEVAVEVVAEASAKVTDKERKRGELLVMAIEKGGELATSFEDSMLHDFQKKLGKKFVASATGLTIAEGATITEQDAGAVIAFLTKSTERETKVRTTINLALGDAVIAIRNAFGDEAGDQVIQQATDERGQSKHTLMDCERTVEKINVIYKDHADRPVGLSYTHFQELKNGAFDRKGNQLIPTAKVKSIIKKVVDGDGHGNVLSCAELREMLNAANGKKPKPKPEDGGDGDTETTPEEKEKTVYQRPLGFLYMKDVETIYSSEELDEDALKLQDPDGEFTYGVVIDLDKMVLIKPGSKGKKLADITELPEVQPESEELPG